MTTKRTSPQWIVDHREELFACAVAEYKAGVQWWLTDREDMMRRSDAGRFRVGTEFESFVAEQAKNCWCVDLGVIANKWRELNGHRGPRNGRTTAAMILEGLGFDRRKFQMRGVRQYWYVRHEATTDDIRALGPAFLQPQPHPFPGAELISDNDIRIDHEQA